MVKTAPGLISLTILAALAASPSGRGEGDAQPPPIPPAGIAVPDETRTDLTIRAAALLKEIDILQKQLAGKPELLARIPDVQIFHKAVDWALRHNEFFEPKQFETAKGLLTEGAARAAALLVGRTPWDEQTGLVVRGYQSQIDGSIQPYGMIVPEQWKPADRTPRRLDFWFHGRGEKLTELTFIADRMKNKGEFAPEGAFVLHLYGRFCNANKFAGEMDLFEAWNNARSVYPIDPERVLVRGFSMGGASTWQFATHRTGFWAAAAPGAGFAESENFLRIFAAGKTPPPWWEQVLYRWYDSTIYAANLANLPVVAYSGEIDGQRQAANEMAAAMEKAGFTLTQVIGPGMGHQYHPESKPKIEEFLEQAISKPAAHDNLHLTTYTLIYSKNRWLEIAGMEKPWERADADAEAAEGEIKIKTSNVSAIHITRSAGRVVIDGAILPQGATFVGKYQKQNGSWQVASPPKGDALEKSSTLCGPIDHAFMGPFLMVRPTGKPLNEKAGVWAASEMAHAVEFWRRVFRGDSPIKDDTAVTANDIATRHLILWGDPSSNAIWKRLAAKLPMKWSADRLEVAGHAYEGSDYAPIFIYPNPLSAGHYVVLNSGVTFREQALLNNADQTPKLPDWAVIDLRTPPGPRWPGLVVDAGFFDSEWKFQQAASK